MANKETFSGTLGKASQASLPESKIKKQKEWNTKKKKKKSLNNDSLELDLKKFKVLQIDKKDQVIKEIMQEHCCQKKKKGMGLLSYFNKGVLL